MCAQPSFLSSIIKFLDLTKSVNNESVDNMVFDNSLIQGFFVELSATISHAQ